MNEKVPNYTKEDFLTGTKPFEWLWQFRDNKLKFKQLTSVMQEKAKSVKVLNFVALLKAYMEMANLESGVEGESVTEFTNQPAELRCGRWTADDFGVTTTDKFGFEVVACSHPIMPVQRLVNIDTGLEKLKLAFSKGGRWREIIVDKTTLASKNSITNLAGFGVAVNSENAKYLVQYLTDIEALNYREIEEVTTVSRLGWIDDYGFSPYVDNLVFDGEDKYKSFFEAVKERGDREKWFELAEKIRNGSNIVAKFVLSASFASVLVHLCDALPFFVHLWGGSEAGKTVGIMVAASVWGNPRLGSYVRPLNATVVGQEEEATFVNSMPLIMDELQMIKDKKNFDAIIYALTEGVGKTRSQKQGGLRKSGTWQNCMLTTGEMPIACDNSGGGAVNRVIQIDCKDIRLFNDPVRVVETVKQNYGFAGREFIETLSDPDNMKYAKDLQKCIFELVANGETTEKQALAASIILTADQLIDEWIFKDGQKLKLTDIEPFLSTKKDVSANERALAFLYDFVAINTSKFLASETLYSVVQNEKLPEIWGVMDGEYTYIIKSQFDKIMQNEGYNATAFLSWAKQNDIITCEKNKTTKLKRILGRVTRCVFLKNAKMDENPDITGNIDIPY